MAEQMTADTLPFEIEDAAEDMLGDLAERPTTRDAARRRLSLLRALTFGMNTPAINALIAQAKADLAANTGHGRGRKAKARSKPAYCVTDPLPNWREYASTQRPAMVDTRHAPRPHTRWSVGMAVSGERPAEIIANTMRRGVAEVCDCVACQHGNIRARAECPKSQWQPDPNGGDEWIRSGYASSKRVVAARSTVQYLRSSIDRQAEKEGQAADLLTTLQNAARIIIGVPLGINPSRSRVQVKRSRRERGTLTDGQRKRVSLTDRLAELRSKRLLNAADRMLAKAEKLERVRAQIAAALLL